AGAGSELVIDDRDVEVHALRGGERPLGGRVRVEDLEIRFDREQLPHAQADRRVVVDDNAADRRAPGIEPDRLGQAARRPGLRHAIDHLHPPWYASDRCAEQDSMSPSPKPWGCDPIGRLVGWLRVSTATGSGPRTGLTSARAAGCGQIPQTGDSGCLYSCAH